MEKDEPEAAGAVLEALEKDGVKVVLNAAVTEVQNTSKGIATTINQNAAARTVTSEALLLAIGRQPNVEDLGLELAKVTFSARGIAHDKHLKTSNPHIYVAGDVAGDYQFTHYASSQAGTAVQNLLFPIFKATVTNTVPWCTFTSPEVAHTGHTIASAKAANIPHEVLTFPLDHVDRALAEDKTTGFIQLLLGKGDQIIGATIVCENAGDMIQELTLAIAQKLTVEDVLKVIHVYPTYSSGIQQALFYRFLKSNALLVRVGKLVAKYI
jgi:pyruvate/2-oxoglutarate dehydrogenase complex dihydrolipoamide dehydrogenase (E3) component